MTKPAIDPEWGEEYVNLHDGRVVSVCAVDGRDVMVRNTKTGRCTVVTAERLRFRWSRLVALKKP